MCFSVSGVAGFRRGLVVAMLAASRVRLSYASICRFHSPSSRFTHRTRGFENSVESEIGWIGLENFDVGLSTLRCPPCVGAIALLNFFAERVLIRIFGKGCSHIRAHCRPLSESSSEHVTAPMFA